MKALTHKELKNIIKTAYNNKVALFIWGATGIGKSDTIRQTAQELAKENKLPFAEGVSEENSFGLIDARLSQFDPSDLRGLPFVSSDGKTKWAYPNWLPTKGKGLLFLDEANLAPPLVQSSAYQLILDRRLGDYQVPPGWAIIAAGNRLEDKAYTFELAAPLCNRFIHAELGVPNIEDWSEWAIEQGVDSRIVTFLMFKPAFLFKFDSKLKDKAFPTPRSWAKYCSPIIKGSEDYGEMLTLISSAVGEGVATECVAYLKLSKAIDLKDILEHPDKIKDIKGIDVKYSLVSALSEFIKKDTATTLPKVCKCAEVMEAEFSILLLRFIKSNIQMHKLLKFIQDNKVVAGVYKKYAKYVCSDLDLK